MAGFKYAVMDFRNEELINAKHGEEIYGITVLRFDIHHEAIGVTNRDHPEFDAFHIFDRDDAERFSNDKGGDEDAWKEILRVMDGGLN
jgi:hypothetical protein